MKIHRLFFLAMCLNLTLSGTVAHGSYVVEAEGMGISPGAMATDFDFVVHDFGMEPKDAIQITLDNLSSATNLQGDLLLRSFPFVSGEDYSYYDNGAADADQNADGLFANIDSGENYPMLAATAALLPEGGEGFSLIDTNAILRMIGPTSFTSFSQLTAARFGFYYNQ